MREEWVVVEEAPTYAVSNYGRVVNLKTERILRPGLSHNYSTVSLRHQGRSLPKKIHRLVAKAFVPGYRPDLDVRHIDGDQLNNEASNLEWISRRDSIRHALRDGRSVAGRSTPVRIIETGEVFDSQVACANAIGGTQSGVNAVLRGYARRYRGYTFEYA